MVSSSALLKKYIDRSMHTVQGYLTVQDACITAALLSYQSEHGISGNLCEIGVHHGRLFLMLALARNAGEAALAIDLFEDDAINAGTRHAGRNTALLANARRLGIELSEREIFKTSSVDIKPSDILARTGGRIRFFSVDGCHLYRFVANDLQLAESTMAEGGIIAVDDFFNKDWADASLATYDFLRDSDTWVPFAITSKLFLAAPAAAEKYRAALSRCGDIGNIYNVQMLGLDVLTAKMPVLRRGCDMLRDLILGHVS